MLNRIAIAAVLTFLLGAFASQATAAPPTDFWINKHFMNMAHQGGETEAPGNTLFAFKTAAARGADVIEMDGYLTEDGKFVITHDMEPHKTSDAPYSAFDSTPPINHTNPDQFVTNQTLAELRAFDFGYKFTPGKGHYGYTGTDDYPYRGIATGLKPPPEGFTAADFQIATLEQVLDALPNMPMSVDMKAPRGDTTIATAAATEVGRIMNEHPERSEDVLIVSFFQEALDKFHELAPGHKAMGGTESGILSYVQGNPISPTPVAVQPPDTYDLGGNLVDTVPILKPKTDADGYAIHVWPANDSIDGPALWQKMIDQGANGFFTDRPSQLHDYLCSTGVPRPDGTPRCASQVCPEGQTGIAPNKCVDIPIQQCPEGQVGTPPNCSVVIVDPATILTAVSVSPKKGNLKAGKTLKLKLTIKATPGMGPNGFKVNLKSSNRQVKLPKSVVVNLKGNQGSRTIKVRATRKARGKATITATSGKFKAKATLKVKPAQKKKSRARGR